MHQERDKQNIIIVGGGISGLGIAYRLTQAGLPVTLFEQGTLACATSSNTMRIIHGGFRYLQNFDFPRVVQSLRDQDRLFGWNEFIKPFPCVMPLNRTGLKSVMPLTAAGLFYNGLWALMTSKFRKKVNVHAGSEIENLVPLLKGKAQYGYLEWEDGLIVDPASFAWFLSKKIKDHGGVIREGTKVQEISSRHNGFAVSVKSSAGDEVIESAVVVNATGPWIEGLRPKDISAPKHPRGWCKAFNLVLREQLEKKFGVGLSGPEGRLYFFAPRGDNSVVGTFHEIQRSPQSPATVSAEEIERAIQNVNLAVPELRLAPSDVVSVDVGILPMSSIQNGEPVLYGGEEIFSQGGYIEVMSTKYTTFLSQGAKVTTLVKAIFHE